MDHDRDAEARRAGSRGGFRLPAAPRDDGRASFTVGGSRLVHGRVYRDLAEGGPKPAAGPWALWGLVSTRAMRQRPDVYSGCIRRRIECAMVIPWSSSRSEWFRQDPARPTRDGHGGHVGGCCRGSDGGGAQVRYKVGAERVEQAPPLAHRPDEVVRSARTAPVGPTHAVDAATGAVACGINTDGIDVLDQD